MATFTMMLNELLGVDNPRDADPSAIGLDDYPIWDDGYRGELNHKIIMRFWNREIGFETPSMFIHHMRRLMGEIMPYYNELAKTTTMRFDPFETLNITTESESETDVETTGTTQTDTEGTTTTEHETSGTTHTDTEDTTTTEQETSSTESGESTQNTAAENSSRSVNSDHPQTRLNEYENYATSSSDAVSSSVSESDGTSSGSQQSSVTGQDTSSGSQSGSQHSSGTGQDTTTGTQHGVTDGEQRNRHRDKQTQRGTQGNKAQLLQQYRDTIMGVDVLILDELEVLFMGVWDTDQAYTRIEPSWFDPYPSMF